MKIISRTYCSIFLVFLLFCPLLHSESQWQNVKTWIYNEQPFADSSNGSQYLVPANHWIYDSIRMLTLETGAVSLVNKSPLSAAELEVFFNDICYERLSPYGKKLYNNAEKWFSSIKIEKKGLPLNLSLQPSLNLAFFYRNTNHIYPEFDYRDIPPLFSMPVSISALNYAYLHYDLSVFQRYEFANSAFRFTNISFSDNEYDGTISHLSHLSLGVPIRGRNFWNFKIGKGGLNIGHTATPSIILSDRMETATYAQLTFFGSNIRYAGNVTQLAVNKYLYYHTLDFKLFKRITISAIEGVMVNAPFELTYLNPLELFHGLQAWNFYKDYNRDLSATVFPDNGDSRVGSLLALSAEINPWKYSRLYFLFQMNQYQLSYETKTIPNAIGCQSGLDIIFPLKNGYLTANIEGLWTSPYMYKLENKNWSFCMNRRGFYGSGQFQWTGGGEVSGPDTIMAQISSGFSAPGKWNCNTFYRFLIQGAMHKNTAANENGFWKTFPGKDNNGEPDNNKEKALAMATVKTPTGIPQYTHRLGIEGSYILNRHFKFKGYSGFAYRINNDNKYGNPVFGFEAAVAAEFSIFGGKKTIIQ